MSPWSFTVYLTYRISVSWSHVRSPVSIALANQSAVTSPIPGGRSRYPRGLMARMPGAQRAPADPCHQTSEGATPRPLTPSRSRSQGEAGRSRATPWSRGGVASPDTESRHPLWGLATRAWVRGSWGPILLGTRLGPDQDTSRPGSRILASRILASRILTSRILASRILTTHFLAGVQNSSVQNSDA